MDIVVDLEVDGVLAFVQKLVKHGALSVKRLLEVDRLFRIDVLLF